jgi:hypothetical protein
MRLQSYINEYIGDDEDVDRVDGILSKCRDFIKECGRKLLYRGVSSDEAILVKTARKSRTPKDTSIEVHKMLDKMFYEEFGVRPRSHGVFATSDINASLDYGTPYVFLPKGKYSYIWSPKISDLFSDHVEGFEAQLEAVKMKREYELEIVFSKKDLSKQQKDKYIAKRMKEETDILMKNLRTAVKTYQMNNLKGAIKSQNEIMFLCNSYYLINIEFEDYISDVIEDMK